MNAITTLSASFSGLTKTGIEAAATDAVDAVLEGGDPLKTAELVSALEIFFKKIKEDARFPEAVREELGKHGGVYTSPSGARLEHAEAGVAYDYTGDAKWRELKQNADNVTSALKKHEETLRKIQPGKLLVDEATGEVFTGPVKTSKSTYKVTLKK